MFIWVRVTRRQTYVRVRYIRLYHPIRWNILHSIAEQLTILWTTLSYSICSNQKMLSGSRYFALITNVITGNKNTIFSNFRKTQNIENCIMLTLVLRLDLILELLTWFDMKSVKSSQVVIISSTYLKMKLFFQRYISYRFQK